jgi:hypothetical protein
MDIFVPALAASLVANMAVWLMVLMWLGSNNGD